VVTKNLSANTLLRTVALSRPTLLGSWGCCDWPRNAADWFPRRWSSHSLVCVPSIPIACNASQSPTQGGQGCRKSDKKKIRAQSHDALPYQLPVSFTIDRQRSQKAPRDSCYRKMWNQPLYPPATPFYFPSEFGKFQWDGSPALLFGLWWQIRWVIWILQQGSVFRRDGIDGNESENAMQFDFWY